MPASKNRKAKRQAIITAVSAEVEMQSAQKIKDKDFFLQILKEYTEDAFNPKIQFVPSTYAKNIESLISLGCTSEEIKNIIAESKVMEISAVDDFLKFKVNLSEKLLNFFKISDAKIATSAVDVAAAAVSAPVSSAPAPAASRHMPLATNPKHATAIPSNKADVKTKEGNRTVHNGVDHYERVTRDNKMEVALSRATERLRHYNRYTPIRKPYDATRDLMSFSIEGCPKLVLLTQEDFTAADTKLWQVLLQCRDSFRQGLSDEQTRWEAIDSTPDFIDRGRKEFEFFLSLISTPFKTIDMGMWHKSEHYIVAAPGSVVIYKDYALEFWQEDQKGFVLQGREPLISDVSSLETIKQKPGKFAVIYLLSIISQGPEIWDFASRKKVSNNVNTVLQTVTPRATQHSYFDSKANSSHAVIKNINAAITYPFKVIFNEKEQKHFMQMLDANQNIIMQIAVGADKLLFFSFLDSRSAMACWTCVDGGYFKLQGSTYTKLWPEEKLHVPHWATNMSSLSYDATRILVSFIDCPQLILLTPEDLQAAFYKQRQIDALCDKFFNQDHIFIQNLIVVRDDEVFSGKSSFPPELLQEIDRYRAMNSIPNTFARKVEFLLSLIPTKTMIGNLFLSKLTLVYVVPAPGCIVIYKNGTLEFWKEEKGDFKLKGAVKKLRHVSSLSALKKDGKFEVITYDNSSSYSEVWDFATQCKSVDTDLKGVAQHGAGSLHFGSPLHSGSAVAASEAVALVTATAGVAASAAAVSSATHNKNTRF